MDTSRDPLGPGRWRTLSCGFDAAAARLPAALEREGFGIITQIDLAATLKNKLGVDIPRYRIFGACNPSFAHAALSEDPRVGVLLPCNVVLREGEGGEVVLGAVNPMETLGASASSAKLRELAREVDARLERVLGALAE